MISIIIPIYNASQYIAKGHANVTQQTYTDWELIYVNDGSLDDSALLLDDLVSKDKRVKVIHQQNAGPGIARNTGLKEAKGEWIYFYDIDDEINSNLLRYCLEQGEKYNADIVTFGFDAYDVFTDEHTLSMFEYCVMCSNKAIGEHWAGIMRQSVIGNGFPWNKLYRRSVLKDNNIFFGTERLMEDELFNLRLLRVAKSMIVMRERYYTYYCNNVGNSRKKFLLNRFEIITDVRKEMFQCINHWQLNDKRLSEYIENRYWEGIKLCLFSDDYHPDNFQTFEKKRKYKADICSRSEVFQCVNILQNTGCNFEDRRYINAILKQNLYAVYFWGKLFSLLRVINNKRKFLLQILGI